MDDDTIAALFPRLDDLLEINGIFLKTLMMIFLYLFRSSVSSPPTYVLNPVQC